VGHRGNKVWLDLLDLKVHREDVVRGFRVQEGRKDRLAESDHRELKAHAVQARREFKALKERWVFKAHRVWEAESGIKVQGVHRALQEDKAHKAVKEDKAFSDRKAYKARLAFAALKDHKDYQEHKEFRDLLAFKAFRDLLDLKEHRVRKEDVVQDHRGHKVLLVLRVWWERWVLKAFKAYRDRSERACRPCAYKTRPTWTISASQQRGA